MADTNESVTRSPRGTPGAALMARSALVAGFDDLPNEALISVPAASAVIGKGESSFWLHAKQQEGHPKVIKLSARCSRVRVGDLRAYLAKLSGGQ